MAESAGAVQPGEEETQGIPSMCMNPCREGAKTGARLFPVASIDGTRSLSKY